MFSPVPPSPVVFILSFTVCKEVCHAVAHRLTLPLQLKESFFPQWFQIIPLNIEFPWTEIMYLSLNPISQAREMEHEWVDCPSLLRECRVSQPWHSWQFRLGNALLWELVLCTVGFFQVLTSTTRCQPEIPLPPSHDNIFILRLKKCLKMQNGNVWEILDSQRSLLYDCE